LLTATLFGRFSLGYTHSPQFRLRRISHVDFKGILDRIHRDADTAMNGINVFDQDPTIRSVRHRAVQSTFHERQYPFSAGTGRTTSHIPSPRHFDSITHHRLNSRRIPISTVAIPMLFPCTYNHLSYERCIFEIELERRFLMRNYPKIRPENASMTA